MSSALLLLLAATPVDFDLKLLPTSRGCVARSEDDILVCGMSTSERQRVRPAPESYPDKPLVAEMALPNGWKANLNVTSAVLPGAVSNRAMVTLKMPF